LSDPQPTRNRRRPPSPLVAMALAWLLPGVGHVYLGQYLRGAVLFVTIAGTFWAGVAMGGVMTVDSVNERWWFTAQMLSGAHGLVSRYREQRVWNSLATQAGSRRAGVLTEDVRQALLSERKIALVYPMDTVARAYSGVAGLLNLMCIFDAVILAMLWGKGTVEPAGAGRRQ